MLLSKINCLGRIKILKYDDGQIMVYDNPLVNHWTLKNLTKSSGIFPQARIIHVNNESSVSSSIIFQNALTPFINFAKKSNSIADVSYRPENTSMRDITFKILTCV